MFCFNSDSLATLADIAQVIIAIANLGLAFYVIIYQIGRDKKTELQAAKINEQNIRLQWFRELVIQPNQKAIETFYFNLHSLTSKINSNDLSEEEKLNLNAFVKNEASTLRKAFVDILHGIDSDLSHQVQNNIDTLVDTITEAIFNDELKLNNPDTYEKQIGSKISYSQNNLISIIFNYKAIA